MKKELTVFALAAGLISLLSVASSCSSNPTGQPVKLTEQQLDDVGLGLAIRHGHVRPGLGADVVTLVNTRNNRRTGATNAEIVELIESGIILKQARIDLDNYQTPPKDPCDWSWVYCLSACEQNWWVYCTEKQ
ncbi:MAG TPA: hypothetical protein VMR88_05630 [Candidatus Polarisedimenticolaceae bacterium]|jgi:hypothetical protein|nr:hypothetical protein [Candidatus Polarisedimenticolaceae bacterium]